MAAIRPESVARARAGAWTCLMLAALAVGTTARAQVRDVTVGADGDRAQLAIHFAAPPVSAQAAPDPAGLVIHVEGAAATSAVWSLVPGAPVRELVVTPEEGGATLTVATRAPVLAARAFVRDAAVVVDVTLAAPAPPPRDSSALYASAPRAVPRPSPTTPVAERSAAPAAARGAEDAERGAPAAAERSPSAMLTEGLSESTCRAARAAVAADPWDLDRLGEHGACLIRAGRPGDAEEVFARLLTFAPDNVDAQLGLGVALLERGRTEDARDVLDAAAAAAVTDAAAARARAVLDTLSPPAGSDLDALALP